MTVCTCGKPLITCLSCSCSTSCSIKIASSGSLPIRSLTRAATSCWVSSTLSACSSAIATRRIRSTSERSRVERSEVDLMRRVAIAEEHALKVLDTQQLVAARVNDLIGKLPDEAILIEQLVLHEQLKQVIKGLPQVQTVIVIGRDGHPLVSANVYPVDRNIDL